MSQAWEWKRDFLGKIKPKIPTSQPIQPTSTSHSAVNSATNLWAENRAEEFVRLATICFATTFVNSYCNNSLNIGRTLFCR